MRVFHGTSERGAESIRKDGIRIAASTGGYFGVAFYVAENREQVATLAQGGDDELDGGLVILEFELALDASTLDCQIESDWQRWLPIGKQINFPDIAKRAMARGIGAIRDINSMGGWAVYDASLLTLVDRPAFGRQYRLTGGSDQPSIARGDSWADSECKS